MNVLRLALASLLFSPLAWGADAAPPSPAPDVLAGVQVLPIKVSAASKRTGDSLKPPAKNTEAVDFTVSMSRTFDENGQPHYHCDADHPQVGLDHVAHDDTNKDSP